MVVGISRRTVKLEQIKSVRFQITQAVVYPCSQILPAVALDRLLWQPPSCFGGDNDLILALLL